MRQRHPIYDRPVGVFAILAAVMVLGALLVPRLAVDIMPSFSSSALFLRGSVESATVKETLEEVTRPLEGMIRGIEGIDSVYSSSRDGRVFLVISPSARLDKQTVLARVGEVVDTSIHQLPDDFSYTIGSWNNDNTPPVAFAIGAGDMHPADFDELIRETVIPALSRIDGVVTVTQGEIDPAQIQVYLERNRITAAEINPQELATQLSSLESSSVVYVSAEPGGDGNDGSERETILHLKLDAGDSSRLEALPVDDGLVLSDVALLNRTQAGAERIVLVNGKPGFP